MVRSVTSTLANHAMQYSRVPAGVCDSLDQIQRNFMWGGNNDSRKPALVRWSSVCTPKDQGGLGIRDSRMMNKALLAKRGWQLYSNSNSLWSKILKAKYLTTHSFLQVQPKNDSSATWKSILSAHHTVTKGIAFSVRNGATARFWLDTWIGTEPLISKAKTSIPAAEQQLTVNKFWGDNTWNWEKIGNTLPQEVIFLLNSNFLDVVSPDDDVLYWKHTTNGLFTTKSAYLSLVQVPNQPVNSNWRKIWDLNCVPKHKSLIWLMYHDRVLTNAMRVRRRMTQDSRCLRCGAAEEMTIHVFRDCPESAAVWRYWRTPDQVHQWRSLSLQQWIEKNISNGSRLMKYNIPWNSAFATICWYLWLGRNHFIFRKGESWIPTH